MAKLRRGAGVPMVMAEAKSGCPCGDKSCGSAEPGGREWHYCDDCLKDGLQMPLTEPRGRG